MSLLDKFAKKVEPVLEPKVKPKKSPEKPKLDKSLESPYLEGPKSKMTIDGLRGLKLLTTGIGDKKSSKETIERELKQRLFNPSEFARFLKNLAEYLESI